MASFKCLAFTLLLAVVSFTAQAQDEYNLNKTYSIEQNGTIHLSSDDADVSIKGTNRSDVHVVVHRKVSVKGWKIESGGFEMEVKNRDGDLYIQELENENSKVILGSVREEYRITIEAPQNVALYINGDDDSYRISDINLGIKLDADDSDVQIRGAKGDDFDFSIDDGSIHMDEGRGRLKLRMDDGEFFAREGQFDEIDADFDDGEINVTTSLADDGFYLFDMDDGDISINVAEGGGRFEISHDDPSIYTSDDFKKVDSDEHRSVYELEGGKARINIDTDDGDVELRTI